MWLILKGAHASTRRRMRKTLPAAKIIVPISSVGARLSPHELASTALPRGDAPPFPARLWCRLGENRARLAPDERDERRRCAGGAQAALCGKGQAGDPPFHGGCAFAARAVRLQA